MVIDCFIPVLMLQVDLTEGATDRCAGSPVERQVDLCKSIAQRSNDIANAREPKRGGFAKVFWTIITAPDLFDQGVIRLKFSEFL